MRGVAELGVGLKLLPQDGRDLILAGALISIMLNPVAFHLAKTARGRIDAKAVPPPASAEAAAPAAPAAAVPAPVAEPTATVVEVRDDLPAPTTETGHTILVGYGRVGGSIGSGLKGDGPCVVIEDAVKAVEAARKAGYETFAGNAADETVLALANPSGARCVVVAIPDAFEAGTVVEQARQANPAALLVARAHSDAEVEHLKKLGADAVVLGEEEIARAMLERIRAGRQGPDPSVAASLPS